MIKGMKVYHVFCRKCDWNKDITIHKDFDEPIGILSKLFWFRKPSNPILKKCPECNSKTEKKHIVF